ncbi:MAG: WbqC family protein [Chlorobiaceae bacterium]|nr:WbqC family protein [Chlorobiaceae bacterium]
MKLAIMQPYFLPYIGYFQLINAVDKYVIYDDVNFIKGGWINRNKILLNGAELRINLPIEGASSFKKINEINVGKNRDKLILTVNQAYKKAPYYNDVFPLLLDIMSCEAPILSYFLKNSIIKICEYLEIKTNFILSSEINKNNELKGEEKVISICNILRANEYYNSIGGQELYNKDTFSDNNVDLKFIKTLTVNYKQFLNTYIFGLSILDVMMFCSKKDITCMLKSYEIL